MTYIIPESEYERAGIARGTRETIASVRGAGSEPVCTHPTGPGIPNIICDALPPASDCAEPHIRDYHTLPSGTRSRLWGERLHLLAPMIAPYEPPFGSSLVRERRVVTWRGWAVAAAVAAAVIVPLVWRFP